MSSKQENLTDNGAATNDMKKSGSTKTISNTENLKSVTVKPKIEEILKLISPAKSKFFMPKPRISSHSKNEPVAHVKSMVDIKNVPLEQNNMVATEATDSKLPQVNEDTENQRIMKKEATEEELNNQDTCNMLAITISCVMLMASNVPKISEEYLSWAENYLSQIKDKNGNHPPNIQGILNHIKYTRIKQAIPETIIPNNNKINKFSSRFSDIRGCSNSSCGRIKLKQYLEKQMNSSCAGDGINKKRISTINRTSSCATFAGISQPIQKTK